MARRAIHHLRLRGSFSVVGHRASSPSTIYDLPFTLSLHPTPESRMKSTIIAVVAAVAFVSTLIAIRYAAGEAARHDRVDPQGLVADRPVPAALSAKKYDAPPPMTIDVSKTYTAT